MSQKKRKHFNIEEKTRIISKLESGSSNKDLAKEYGVPHSTISGIWREREKIKTLYDCNYLKMKRARTTKHTKIEDALLDWVKYQMANNEPVTGPILQRKANDFAMSFGEDFVCSASWIQRFRARHGITGGKMYEEEWVGKKWPLLCESYTREDIFSAKETGLFYNMTPDRTQNFKGENCCHGEMSKERLTVMVAANMIGSSKRKLLVIGKYRKPSLINNSLPVTYDNNVKSWMTSDIFERWLRDWDAELTDNNRKIVLLVDNNHVHTDVTNLKCIKLVFLPPNVLHPLDQGVIRCLKYHYRRLQILNMIQNLDSEIQKSVTVLDAILMISEAWDNVSQNAIANCFKHADFKDLFTPSDDDDDPLSLCVTDYGDEDISLAKLAQSLRPVLSAAEAEQFIDVDSGIAICAAATKDDIVHEIKEEDDEETEEFAVPNLNEGLNAVSILRRLLLFNEQFQGLNDRSNYDDVLIKIQRELQSSYVSKVKLFRTD